MIQTNDLTKEISGLYFLSLRLLGYYPLAKLMRQTFLLPVFAASLSLLNVPCNAQLIKPMKSVETARREVWRHSMRQIHLPKNGCFKASYPSNKWQEESCTTAPNVPYLPANGPSPKTVGNGDDFAGHVTSGLLSSAEGTFLYSSGITYINGYSLQLNTNFFNTPACNGAANPSQCLGWQQFVYSETHGQVFMQYWLLNWGTTCPSGWTPFTQYGPIDCWINSSSTNVPGVPFDFLPYMALTGEAGGSTDTVMFDTGDGNLHTVVQDSVLDLEQYWTDGEFNVFGDCCENQVSFNSGSTLIVQTALNNGTTNTPICPTEGFTGETNNLNLAPQSAPVCCPVGGSSTSIQFMESNASGATATCNSEGLAANIAAMPSNSSSYYTYGGWYPTIEFTETLYDSTPEAEIYWNVDSCSGSTSGGDPLNSGDSFNLEYQSSYNCNPSGTMYATAPGSLPSQTTSISF